MRDAAYMFSHILLSHIEIKHILDKFVTLFYIICNPAIEMNKPKSQPKMAVSHNAVLAVA